QHSCPAYATNVPPAHLLYVAVSNFCNALLAEKFRQPPQAHLISASLETLGRNMAWLMKSLAFSHSAVPAPDAARKVYTNFVR
ncbi:MAG: hypothetical protein LUD69_06765, partial [Oscillospiraceae bacterium]|nr:hypothetical protein [Oscillospiraceae bacterium]